MIALHEGDEDFLDDLCRRHKATLPGIEIRRKSESSDYAAVDSGRIPDYILKDEKLVAQLPVFFRTLRPETVREDLEKLVELIRSVNRPCK